MTERLLERGERVLVLDNFNHYYPVQLKRDRIARTYADIEAIARDLGYQPKTPIDVGIPIFVDWLREYTGR